MKLTFPLVIFSLAVPLVITGGCSQSRKNLTKEVAKEMIEEAAGKRGTELPKGLQAVLDSPLLPSTAAAVQGLMKPYVDAGLLTRKEESVEMTDLTGTYTDVLYHTAFTKDWGGSVQYYQSKNSSWSSPLGARFTLTIRMLSNSTKFAGELVCEEFNRSDNAVLGRGVETVTGEFLLPDRIQLHYTQSPSFASASVLGLEDTSHDVTVVERQVILKDVSREFKPFVNGPGVFPVDFAATEPRGTFKVPGARYVMNDTFRKYEVSKGMYSFGRIAVDTVTELALVSTETVARAEYDYHVEPNAFGKVALQEHQKRGHGEAIFVKQPDGIWFIKE